MALALSCARAATPPNVIFVLADDLGYGDLSSHGHPRIKPPNIDRLRSQRVRFTDHHVSSVGAPSRSELMTGIDAYRNGVSDAIVARNLPRRELPLMPSFSRTTATRRRTSASGTSGTATLSLSIPKIGASIFPITTTALGCAASRTTGKPARSMT